VKQFIKKLICRLWKHKIETTGNEEDQDGRVWLLHICHRCGKGFKTAHRTLPHPEDCSLVDVEEWDL
jgi:hypothetical protein